MNSTTVERTAPEGRKQAKQEREGRSEASGCLVRVYWMLLGNAVVALFAYGIVHQGGALTGIDVLYWLATAGLLAARYVDVRFLDGTTAEGEPATTKHWRRYALLTLAVSLGLWLGAHGLGYVGVIQ